MTWFPTGINQLEKEWSYAVLGWLRMCLHFFCKILVPESPCMWESPSETCFSEKHLCKCQIWKRTCSPCSVIAVAAFKGTGLAFPGVPAFLNCVIFSLGLLGIACLFCFGRLQWSEWQPCRRELLIAGDEQAVTKTTFLSVCLSPSLEGS